MGNNDKKKIYKIKDDFLADCLSNITNFQVRLVTDFFARDEARLVSTVSGLTLKSMKLLKYLKKNPRQGLIRNAKTYFPWCSISHS